VPNPKTAPRGPPTQQFVRAIFFDYVSEGRDLGSQTTVVVFIAVRKGNE
jgi:hypothetical protein